MENSLMRSKRLEEKEVAKASRESKFACLRRNKRQAIQNEPLLELVEQVELTNFFDRLPNELLRKIMDILELWEQFSVRRVCHRWKLEIESKLSKIPKECLKLNVKWSQMFGQDKHEPRCLRTWEPNSSIRRKQFEFVYKEPVFAPSKLAQISINDRAFNTLAAEALGRIFSQVKTLIIFWDTDDRKSNIYNLVVFLRQFTKCSVLTTFGLIISGKMHRSSTMTKICDVINTNKAQLKQLHLMVPGGIEPMFRQHGEDTDLVPHRSAVLDKAIAYVNNFSMTCTMDNSSSLLENVCQKQNDESAYDIGCPQLESLSISLYFDNEESQDEFNAALDSKKHKFASVKRLVLVDIEQLEDVQRLLKYFPNVEHLFMKLYPTSMETFGFNWIRTLKPLTKLTELILLNFHFESKSLTLRDQPDPIGQTVNLRQLRKLTFACPDLIFNLRTESNPLGVRCPIIPRLKPEDIGHTINLRFPGLHEINLWSGDCELHETEQKTWQTVEQNINRDLPLSLPLLPGLRVNIQLGHPLLYDKYLALPYQVLNTYAMANEVSEAQRLNANLTALNEIIEGRLQLADLINQNELANGPIIGRAFREITLFLRQIRTRQVVGHEDVVEGLEDVLAQIRGIVNNHFQNRNWN